MIEINCPTCGGCGRTRQGSVVAPVDPNYNFLSGFELMCSGPEYKKECAERAKRLILLVEIGDRIRTSSQFSSVVLDVGMYDGWPFWHPVPAALQTSPLGGAGDWAFYYKITGVQKQGTEEWIR